MAHKIALCIKIDKLRFSIAVAPAMIGVSSNARAAALSYFLFQYSKTTNAGVLYTPSLRNILYERYVFKWVNPGKSASGQIFWSQVYLSKVHVFNK